MQTLTGMGWGATAALRFGADAKKAGKKPEADQAVTVDESKLDAKLKLALRQGDLQGSLLRESQGKLLLKTQGKLTPEQIQELKVLGLNATPLVRDIATGSLDDACTLENFAKITRIPYISYLEGAIGFSYD
jgi:hypothetical protein